MDKNPCDDRHTWAFVWCLRLGLCCFGGNLHSRRSWSLFLFIPVQRLSRSVELPQRQVIPQHQKQVRPDMDKVCRCLQHLRNGGVAIAIDVQLEVKAVQ